MTDSFILDKKHVRRSFERAASTYDAVAILQRQVGERMLARLQYIKLSPQHVLDVGAGTGAGTHALAQRYPGSKIIALDVALSMLQMARRKRPWWQRYLPLKKANEVYVCADAENLPLKDAGIDMIWSNLTFQWCNDLDVLFNEMNRVLSHQGILMFTTFGPDTLRELRSAFQGSDSYTHINRFIDMHDIGDALIRAGFHDPVMDVEHFTLTYNDVSDLMRDLKSLGAHAATHGRRRGLAGKTAWQRMRERYEQLRVDGKLPATYEVVYGHAWSKGPKQLSHAENMTQIIKLDLHRGKQQRK